MLQEVLERLALRPGGLYLDATVGLGGHAAAILDRLAPDGRLLGLDQDPEALPLARDRLQEVVERHCWSLPEPFRLQRANFSEFESVLEDACHWVLGTEGGSLALNAQRPSPHDPISLRGALFDLGVSSLQLDRPDRGFSIRSDGPLDMRMDPDRPWTAADLVNTLPERELERIIGEYGEERWARRVARAIVQARERSPLTTTSELSTILERAVPRTPRLKIHPATRTFQALRIAVNAELDCLRAALEACIRRLEPEGRIVVLSYHSLEDRIVKQTFNRLSGRCACPSRVPVCACGVETLLRPITRKPQTPSEEEVDRNPRSRSARLRAAERLGSN